VREWTPATPEEREQDRRRALATADRVVSSALSAGLVDFDQADQLADALHDLVERGDWQRAALIS